MKKSGCEEMENIRTNSDSLVECNMVHMRQGNVRDFFFKVRELSGNFMIYQGNMKYC